MKTLLEDKQDVNSIFEHQSLLYIQEIISIQYTTRHHNITLYSNLNINETVKLVAKNYYWPTSFKVVEVYV